jgi:chloramphenicol 3-O phosphotransferase
MEPGNIILLNGTSSLGKTTIASALQKELEAPYLHTGIDQLLIKRLPKRMIVYSDGEYPSTAEGWLAIIRDGALSEVRIGPLGYQWVKGMYHAVAALAGDGLNVILDDVIYNRRVLKAALETLPARQVFFVAIVCPLEIAERRERARARILYDLVHRHGIYDLEVDSSEYSPGECARQIKDSLNARLSPSAFSRLRASL